MNHRMPLTTIVVLLFIALASIGVGYALWSKALHIDGVVKTGSVDSVFVTPFTDDDNFLNDADKDNGDTGKCALYGDGSCDPAASGHNVARKDKDVGKCTVAPGQSPDTLLVTIKNSYPSYFCTVFFGVKNSGTVPVKILNLAVVGPAVTKGYVTGHFTDLQIGQQVDPGDVAPGDLDLHVEQKAPQGQTIELLAKIQLAQWNEATPLAWETCTPGAAPCYEAPEVWFLGNSVTMGELGEGDNYGIGQNMSIHGGAAKLPPAAEYEVTFQWHVCTWDSYNPPTVYGTGYWDSFSVSTSPKPYWKMGYSDPVGGSSFGVVYGGTNYADGILDCSDGTLTKTLPGYADGTYLNVVLDTGTSPESNHAHPSYGTITIDKIVPK